MLDITSKTRPTTPLQSARFGQRYGTKTLPGQRKISWKCLHQAYKCGDYWRSIPNHEQRTGHLPSMPRR
ncbi:hypothetical protein B0H10DRAFT_311687 [Mycena sp. CBHHK59/15]|nr:hypothetical protein B0H10DRAFT_311687 [Mycena sp. CBHHK59/15]